jgi:hypothetical protein
VHDYFSLVTCATNTHHTRMLPSAPTPLEQARLSRLEVILPSASPHCLGHSLNTQKRDFRNKLPSTTIKSIDHTAASSNQQATVSGLHPRLHFRKQDPSSIFTSFFLPLFFIFYVHAVIEAHRESVREDTQPTIPRRFLLGSYRFFGSNKGIRRHDQTNFNVDIR